jgi:Zn-dependent membrane protease YugP
MKPAPENVDGQLVETHEFSHAVEHQVNWSHFLLAGVVLVAVVKFSPAVARMAGSEGRDGR